MKRFLCIAAIVTLLPLSAYGWMMMGRGTVAESGGNYDCETGVSDSNNIVDDTSGTAIDGNGANGGLFTVSESGKLYSISIEVDGGGCTSCTLALRWGTSVDLSSSYNEEVQVVNPGGGEIEFVMTDEDDISTGTSYYWVVEYVSGSTTCYIRYDGDESGYSDFYKGSAQWVLSGAVTNSVPTANIKLCDEL